MLRKYQCKLQEFTSKKKTCSVNDKIKLIYVHLRYHFLCNCKTYAEKRLVVFFSVYVVDAHPGVSSETLSKRFCHPNIRVFDQHHILTINLLKGAVNDSFSLLCKKCAKNSVLRWSWISSLKTVQFKRYCTSYAIWNICY